MSAVRVVLALIRGIIADRAELAAENLALTPALYPAAVQRLNEKLGPLVRRSGLVRDVAFQ